MGGGLAKGERHFGGLETIRRLRDFFGDAAWLFHAGRGANHNKEAQSEW